MKRTPRRWCLSETGRGQKIKARMMRRVQCGIYGVRWLGWRLLGRVD